MFDEGFQHFRSSKPVAVQCEMSELGHKPHVEYSGVIRLVPFDSGSIGKYESVQIWEEKLCCMVEEDGSAAYMEGLELYSYYHISHSRERYGERIGTSRGNFATVAIDTSTSMLKYLIPQNLSITTTTSS